MKRILCAIDLSHEDEAKKIIAEAEKLAGLYQASLSVMTVLPDYGSSWVGSFFKEGTLKKATEAAMGALYDVAGSATAQGDPIQHIVEVGVTYEEILATAQTVAADMIIVGAHKPDLTERLIGPNAARVARNAAVSVLVVRF
ncbi:universal stress protein [Octadecabacter sp. G9-8]|uniref:Universal stress protein n=1 Tax=Octadecabacter dasysiphoniae TaxID=2909341 RepID=A0ABS9D0D0_9RHOB|nr:universal stress protein [Octadecabacter dasysiphoniae]MCF2872980.1 universal stress protein [Octadecabacter dasysiphoniae]